MRFRIPEALGGAANRHAAGEDATANVASSEHASNHAMRMRLPDFLGGATNRQFAGAEPAADIPSAVHHASTQEPDKVAVKGYNSESKEKFASDSASEETEYSSRKVDVEASRGTQTEQAMDQIWSRNEVFLALFFIWLIIFVLAFGNGVTGTLTPYVTSSYSEHSLTALTQVLATLIPGLFKLPYAKIMDIWGRPQALTLGVVLLTVGIIMMAGVNNVETYCAAQVFYWMGFNCIDLSIVVFIADHTKLRWRGLLVAYSLSPYLITTWIYGFAVDSIVYGGTGIRWGFGIFCIIYPVVCMPWLIQMYWKQAKAQKAGLLPARPNRGTFLQAVWYYLIEFDLLGILILATGASLFLLAFNLYSKQPQQWQSPLIICFIIIGFLLMVGFVFYEKFVAPVTFIPWALLKNRTVIGTYIVAFSFYMSFNIWDNYFYSVLTVLFNQPVLYATYIVNIYTIGSCFIGLVFGACLLYFGKPKYYCLFWGVPLTILGAGLMIHFRQPDVNIGYVVMCQIFIALGGGVIVVAEQITLMAVSKQRDFPALLATEATVIAIGQAIGSTIASAIWQGVFPVELANRLPADAQSSLASIYGSFVVQAGYPVGSPTRTAINDSYGVVQKDMLITATCIYAISLIAVLTWQNVDVRKDKKVVY